jgi:phosphatidate cytidylyltransferase
LGTVLTGTLLLLLVRALGEPDRAHLVERIGGTFFGTAYVAMTLAYMVLLRAGPNGFGRLVFVLSIVQMADVFALLGGMAFGRRALTPSLSGGKTWEGLACGIASALVGAQLFAFALPGEPLAHGLAIAFALAIGALAGDLSASALKRAAGLKDFGRLLPGHGGVLDRFDSYMVAAPLAYFVFALLDRLGW